jgi:hypothetical protein
LLRAVEELQRAHAQRLRVGFDADAEREKEREIEIMTAEITRKCMQCGNRIKKVAGAC